MIRISKKTQYGLRAMVYLAKTKKKVCPLKEISEKENIPFDFLEKIFLKLKRGKLIKAKKGIGGGYFLARKPKDIRVGEIIKTLEGTFAPVLCIAKEKEKRIFCPRKGTCRAKNLWIEIQEILNQRLNSITLRDLLRRKKYVKSNK